MEIGLQPAVAERFGGLDGLLWYRLDAGAKNLHIERAGIERQADRGPGEVRDDRNLDPRRIGHPQV
jgi:hypothetical protein